MAQARPRKTVFGRLPRPERQTVAEALRTETVGGVILLVAAVVALVWANSPWSAAYEPLREVHFGIPPSDWTSPWGTGPLTVFSRSSSWSRASS